MENRLKALEKEIQEMKARHTADFAMLDTLVRTLPTHHLEVLLTAFTPLAEELKIKFIYGPWSEFAHQAASEKLQVWQVTMAKELQARQSQQSNILQL